MGRILLHCTNHQLAVHSIHSASDAAEGGINDWLARALAPGHISPIICHPKAPAAGQGRILECSNAIPLSSLVERLKSLLQVRCASSQKQMWQIRHEKQSL
eukprot:scaffold34759_cov37-Tisochrysis_lutea.AAC.2